MSSLLHQRASVSLPIGLQLATAAVDRATELGAALTVVVADSTGEVLVSLRMDGAAPISPIAAGAKAWTSAALGLSTAQWGVYTTLEQPLAAPSLVEPRLTSMPGGLPLVVDGAVVGSVAASGGSAEQDVEAAEAAVALLAKLGAGA